METKEHQHLKGDESACRFSEELSKFQNAHPYKNTKVDGVSVDYLLCGNECSRVTLIYLVGGTGFSVVWFNHMKRMEKDYRILTFDYPMEINDMEQLADFCVKLIGHLKSEIPSFWARRWAEYWRSLL
ncbi:MAG: hypothetical protein NC541_09955 [bacterium]|nr:hypothetical protein [bacterium]